jgi:uncharacterized membrane protein YuzA (DUF378 family)
MIKDNCTICSITSAIVIVGAINWGLVGVLQIDLVARFLGDMTTPARVVYGIVGVAGVLKLLGIFKLCPCQKK